jgi:hypothetical protein
VEGLVGSDGVVDLAEPVDFDGVAAATLGMPAARFGATG